MEKKLLKEVFGYDEFRPPQQEIIRSVMAKHDTLVIMPTGGGKSICYQIPALMFKGITIVVSPLISLMKDQVDQLRSLGVNAVMLNSSLDAGEYNNAIEEIKSGKARLLYCAPETAMKKNIPVILADTTVDCIAIDEAHCISQWGHDFRPEYRQLASFRNLFPSAPCIALTATATPRVQEDIRERLGYKESNDFIASFNRDNLFYEIIPKNDPYGQTLTFLKNFPDESGIVYCFSRKQVDELCGFLNGNGFPALPYHAGLDDSERRRNQEKFSRDDVKIVVATIAFGMGIHKTNIRFILHFDLPKSIESYYQETGRAGRDGLPARCLLLFSLSDIYKIKYFIDRMEDDTLRAAGNIQLSAITAFAETHECRRIPLLNHFGETCEEKNCGMCDNCLAPPREEVDYTVPAMKFLSCVKRTGELFGFSHIIDVLRGSSSQKILERGHQHLSTYNIGGEFSKKQWMILARQMASRGLLKQDMDSFGSLKLTEKAYSVMKGEAQFFGVSIDEYGTTSGKADSRQYDTGLFSILRTKRKEIADIDGVPPYIVFSDRSLMEMASYYPRSREAFLEIHGVGSGKWDKYGEIFSEVISEYCIENDIAEKRKPPKSGTKKPGEYRHQTVGRAYNEGNSVEELMAEYGVTRSTILNHLARYHIEEEKIRPEGIIHLLQLPDAMKEKIFSAFHEIGHDRMKSVFDHLEGHVDYEDLHLYRIAFMLEAEAGLS